jgi:IclR family acetate operon transcriptional repressor
LEGLAAASGETATLEILMGHEMLIIEEVGGERLLRGGPSIGSRWPAFATSTGQAIMAYLPEPELAAILAAPRPALTPHTITAVDTLRQRLQTIREQGYAVVSEALELGFVAVGAAIRDVDGRPIAAVSLGGPTLRLTEARFPEIYALVRLVADRISRRLGHQPSVK